MTSGDFIVRYIRSNYRPRRFPISEKPRKEHNLRVPLVQTDYR